MKHKDIKKIMLGGWSYRPWRRIRAHMKKKDKEEFLIHNFFSMDDYELPPVDPIDDPYTL